MKKTFLVASMAAVVLLAAVGAGVGFVGYQFLNSRPSDIVQDVVYEVNPGKSFNTIATELESKGLLTNAFFFSM